MNRIPDGTKYVGPCRIACKRGCEVPAGHTMTRVSMLAPDAKVCVFSMAGDADCPNAFLHDGPTGIAQRESV